MLYWLQARESLNFYGNWKPNNKGKYVYDVSVPRLDRLDCQGGTEKSKTRTLHLSRRKVVR